MTTRNGIPTTSATRTLIDLSRVLNNSELDIALHDALHRRLVAIPVLARRMAMFTRPPRGIHRLRRVLQERAGNRPLESTLENRFLSILRRAGLPLPTPQFCIRRPGGTLAGRVDFAYPQLSVAIEIDGYAFHSSQADFNRDRVRQNRLAGLEWLVLRFTAAQLRDPGAVAGTIRSVLQRQTDGKAR